MPFEIPSSWEWVRLGNVCKKEIRRGKSPIYATENTNTLVFAQKCNTKSGKIDFSLAKFLDESVFKKYNEDDYLNKGDIIINSTGTGTLGRICILRDDLKFLIVPDSHVMIVRIINLLSILYIYYFLKFNQKYLEKHGEGSTNQKELKSSIVSNLLIPLPPLAEQKRIVAKIEELFKIIEPLTEK